MAPHNPGTNKLKRLVRSGAVKLISVAMLTILGVAGVANVYSVSASSYGQ
jgi:hypothetical protein